jgi:agmatine deiminase
MSADLGLPSDAVAGTPRAAGLSMPAEWAPHERTMMAWPTRAELWKESFGQAKLDYAEVARAIAAFEPVLMVVPQGGGADARQHVGGDVEIVELPLDDSWLRDSGPVVVTGADGRRAGVDFRFNAWGEKFAPWDSDDALAGRLLERLGIDRYEAPFVLEGGSIAVDGEGTLITTEQCLLNPNRNPGLDRVEIEALLREYVGIETVIWLPHGLAEDHDTDGHVDNVAAFVRPGVVMLQTVADPSSPNHERMSVNRERLLGTPDARGRDIEVIEIDVLPITDVRGEPGCVPYLNYYVCNGGVIVPVNGDDPDRDAEVLAKIARAYGREAVAVPGRTLAEGGGGVHCITQQVPVAS